MGIDELLREIHELNKKSAEKNNFFSDPNNELIDEKKDDEIARKNNIEELVEVEQTPQETLVDDTLENPLYKSQVIEEYKPAEQNTLYTSEAQQISDLKIGLKIGGEYITNNNLL